MNTIFSANRVQAPTWKSIGFAIQENDTQQRTFELWTLYGRSKLDLPEAFEQLNIALLYNKIISSGSNPLSVTLSCSSTLRTISRNSSLSCHHVIRLDFLTLISWTVNVKRKIKPQNVGEKGANHSGRGSVHRCWSPGESTVVYSCSLYNCCPVVVSLRLVKAENLDWRLIRVS